MQKNIKGPIKDAGVKIIFLKFWIKRKYLRVMFTFS